MNFITRGVTSIARICFGRAVEGSFAMPKHSYVYGVQGTLLEAAKKCFDSSMQGLQQIRTISLLRMHRKGPPVKKRKNKNPLDGKPFAKGVVLKTLVKKPKKPNSANRKCVLVRLSTGKEMTAYVPGIGHNLQEHNIVLCRVGKCKDVPGVKIKCVRGVYDLAHVVKQQQK